MSPIVRRADHGQLYDCLARNAKQLARIDSIGIIDLIEIRLKDAICLFWIAVKRCTKCCEPMPGRCEKCERSIKSDRDYRRHSNQCFKETTTTGEPFQVCMERKEREAAA